MSFSEPVTRVRHPRFRVLADGVPLGGVFEIQVTSTDYFSADTFQFRVLRGSRLNGLDDCLLIRDEAALDLQIALDDADGYASLLLGRADALSYDHAAKCVRIKGRNRAALLQDTAANDIFSNLTSSEIVTTLALRHGLLPVVTPTTTLAGRHYNSDVSQSACNHFNRASTEWDLLVFLARCENFELFVRGNCLYFQPNIPKTPLTVLKPADLMDLRLRRRLSMSGDIEVCVKSWNSKQSTAVAQTAISRRTDFRSIFSRIWSTKSTRYSLLQPNLSEDEAGRLALSRVQELTRHEIGVDLVMPGELSMDTRATFALEGTGSLFDQIYRVDSVERSIGGKAGFVQHISAHSISSRTAVLAPELDSQWII